VGFECKLLFGLDLSWDGILDQQGSRFDLFSLSVWFFVLVLRLLADSSVYLSCPTIRSIQTGLQCRSCPTIRSIHTRLTNTHTHTHSLPTHTLHTHSKSTRPPQLPHRRRRKTLAVPRRHPPLLSSAKRTSTFTTRCGKSEPRISLRRPLT
jgi:hypothetical protein